MSEIQGSIDFRHSITVRFPNSSVLRHIVFHKKFGFPEFGFQTVPKSELFRVPISDKIFSPKSEEFSFDLRHYTSLDCFRYNNFYI